MNYKNIYDSLMEKAQSRVLDGYVEKHHIIPKCMGGDNTKSNVVCLSAKEHFIAHKLLVRIYPHTKGVWYALIAMGRIVEFKSRIFESERQKAYATRKGTKYSEESKSKMSLAKLGKASNSPETQFKAGLMPWNKGKFGKEHHLFGSKRTEATRAKMSSAQKACGNIPPSRKGVRMTEEQKAKHRFMRSVKKLQPMLAEFQSIY
jgi:hypothetical protein